MHKLCNVQKTCLPEAVYLVDFEDRELRVSEFNINLFDEGMRWFTRTESPARGYDLGEIP